MGNGFLCFFWRDLYGSKSDNRESVKKMNYGMIQPRISKDMEQQTQRTRKSAEVFTQLGYAIK